MAPRLLSIPGQLTTDTSVLPSGEATKAIAEIANAAKARTEHYARVAEMSAKARGEDPYESEEYRLLAEIRERKGVLESEQARLRALFRRYDNLYYPDSMSLGGADRWPLSKEENRPGKVHVSVNIPPVYVDIPVALQAVPPVENYVAKTPEEDEREAAHRRERLYFQWKEDEEFELSIQKACIIKGLYGFTFAKVYWNAIDERPTVNVIQAPENLYVGWGNSDFSRIDWTIYCYGLSPQAIREDYGLEVQEATFGDGKNAYTGLYVTGTHDDPLGTVYKNDVRATRPTTAYEDDQVEVYDYWYKKPARRKGRKAEVWNAIYVGNALVKNERHKEYDDVPYVAIPNTFVPNLPYGKPEFLDLEQLFREKDERVTNAGQMLQTVVGGQMWQLVGPEAPEDVPAGAIPKPNKVAAPGPGNEIKAVQPWIAQYAVEDYLKRIDVELEVASGLNELLLGRAPATILGSSKAIAALVANYEARIQMKRNLLYQARKRIWKMAAKVWEAKSSDVREIIDGEYRLDVKAPELTPRDELEIAQMAINLVQNRLWSMERAMDRTGVEDPGDEKELIREEQTDPALSPQAVTQQATLLGTLQQLGIQPQQQTVDQAQNAVRQLQQPAAGSQSLNAPENQGNAPAEAQPANARPGNAVLQTLVNGEGAQGRILTQTPLGGEAA